MEAPEARGEVVDLVKRHYKPQTIATLHGKLPQRDRDAALLNFRAGKTNVLVATDVAARGLDVPDVDWVVQLDAPEDADAYVHRVGRAARNGRRGDALPWQQGDDHCAVPGCTGASPDEGRRKRGTPHVCEDFEEDDLPEPPARDAAGFARALDIIGEKRMQDTEELVAKILARDRPPSAPRSR